MDCLMFGQNPVTVEPGGESLRTSGEQECHQLRVLYLLRHVHRLADPSFAVLPVAKIVTEPASEFSPSRLGVEQLRA